MGSTYDFEFAPINSAPYALQNLVDGKVYYKSIKGFKRAQNFAQNDNLFYEAAIEQYESIQIFRYKTSVDTRVINSQLHVYNLYRHLRDDWGRIDPATMDLEQLLIVGAIQRLLEVATGNGPKRMDAAEVFETTLDLHLKFFHRQVAKRVREILIELPLTPKYMVTRIVYGEILDHAVFAAENVQVEHIRCAIAYVLPKPFGGQLISYN